ncbi:hypothetical protein M422DRAFT_26998 [Sphaerobolus stellatus SS14]|nr:hypothetical protein M422DRAFT_26998 [Sphaerobolus stellatus SS14]
MSCRWYKNKLHRKIGRIGRLSSGDTRGMEDLTEGSQEYYITRCVVQHPAAFLPNQIAFFQNRSNTAASSQNTRIAATSSPAPPTLRCVMVEQTVSGLLLLRLPSRHPSVFRCHSSTPLAHRPPRSESVSYNARVIDVVVIAEDIGDESQSHRYRLS